MNWDSRRRRAGDSEGGAEDSGGADWDGPGPWREPEAGEEPTTGGIDAEAALDDDEEMGVEGRLWQFLKFYCVRSKSRKM